MGKKCGIGQGSKLANFLIFVPLSALWPAALPGESGVPTGRHHPQSALAPGAPALASQCLGGLFRAPAPPRLPAQNIHTPACHQASVCIVNHVVQETRLTPNVLGLQNVGRGGRDRAPRAEPRLLKTEGKDSFGTF